MNKFDVSIVIGTYIIFKLPILGFHKDIMHWIWVRVNPKCIDDYAEL